jgi:Family of unknown function (DUF6064)
MLPFTADVLFSSFGQYNRALWPLPVLAWGLGVAAIALALRPSRHGDLAIGALLAMAWLWTGIGYHVLHFATINFVAPLYGGLFILQGLLLAWTGVLRRALAFRFRGDLFGWAGLALAIAALALLPLADWLTGHGLYSLRIAGLAPAPTAAFTLGLLLLVDGRAPLHLAVIPLLWALVAGATGWILSIPQDVAVAVAGFAAFCLILWKTARQARR